MVESRGYGTQYAVEEESRGDLPMQERRQERVPGQGEGIDEHERALGRGASHAHSTSLSTITGSPPQPRGSSGVPTGGVFPGSSFGPGSGYQVQAGYSRVHYGSTQQHTQPPAQVLAHMRAPSQGQYQYETLSALHAAPASGFANPQGRSEFQPQPRQVAELQGQARTAASATRAPMRTSTKRPRPPKRPRQAPYAGIGIGTSRSHLVESDDDSDDDEVNEWVPDWGGGRGAGGSAGSSEVGGAGGGTAQAAPGLPGGRKCVSLLFRYPFLLHCDEV